MIDIPELIDAAGGQVVGKVRLQKLVYLLDRLGVPTDFSFSYHHYGPFSEQLADSVEDSVVFGRVSTETRRRADGVPFVVYKALDHGEGRGMSDRFKSALAAMQQRSAIVLELAATIDWLTSVEQVEDWRRELVRRKGIKANEGRTDAALALLNEIGLVPDNKNSAYKVRA